MDLKAIVLDLDGTLLNEQKLMTTRTKEKLIEAQKKGIKVVLASGRPMSGMLHLAEELEMDQYEGYLVSYNGSIVYDVKTKEIIFDQGVSVEITHKILDHLEQFDVLPMIESNGIMYVKDAFFDIDYPIPSGRTHIVEYEARGGNFKINEVEDLKTVVNQPINKILIAGNPTYLEENYEAMKAPFTPQTTIAFSAPFYFEYTDKGINKARALNEFLPKLGIEAENVIAFGDGENDRSIIEYAGIGVAMGNAVQEILDIADEVTNTNDEDGIAEMLNRFF